MVIKLDGKEVRRDKATLNSEGLYSVWFGIGHLADGDYVVEATDAAGNTSKEEFTLIRLNITDSDVGSNLIDTSSNTINNFNSFAVKFNKDLIFEYGSTDKTYTISFEYSTDGVTYNESDYKITNWADARTMHENYDQFVWVPVDKDSVIVEEGKEITVATNKEKYDNLKGYIAYYNKYPMAVKKSDGTYSVLLYDFEGDSNLKITPKDYTAVTDYIEPAVLEEDEKHNITAIDMDERYKIYGRMELYYIFEIYGKLWI